jgi:hypothetical protein
MPTLKQANAARWANAKVTRASTFASVAKKLVDNKARYQSIQVQTGVPWFVVAVAHQREAGGDFKGRAAQRRKERRNRPQDKLVPKGIVVTANLPRVLPSIARIGVGTVSGDVSPIAPRTLGWRGRQARRRTSAPAR